MADHTTACGVILDLDGTLADTIVDITAAMNETLADLGCPPHPREAYQRFVGDGVRDLVLRALPAGRHDLTDRCLDDFRRRYAARLVQETRPFPGVPELLETLTGRGVPVAVLSNKVESATRTIVAHLFPTTRFRVVAGDRAGRARKPDPHGALEVARQLGVAPPACLLVGDSGVDMATARRAGMVPVGVLWGYRGRDELVAHGATTLLQAPGDLLDVEPLRSVVA